MFADDTQSWREFPLSAVAWSPGPGNDVVANTSAADGRSTAALPRQNASHSSKSVRTNRNGTGASSATSRQFPPL